MLGVIYASCRKAPDLETEVMAQTSEEPSTLEAYLNEHGTPGEGDVRRDALRSNLAERRTVTDTVYDYDWRPDSMVHFPFYFFHAATDIVTAKPCDGTYQWHVKAPGPGVRETERRHPCYKKKRAEQSAMDFQQEDQGQVGAS